MHQYKASEYKIGNRWHVADVTDLAHDSSAWWIPARMLNLSLEDFVLMLVNEYHATIDKWFPNSNNGKSLLLFSWENYTDAHKYLLYINRVSRNKNWTIY